MIQGLNIQGLVRIFKMFSILLEPCAGIGAQTILSVVWAVYVTE